MSADRTAVPRKAKVPIIGKTIADVEFVHDGCSLHDLTIKFTDGTYASFMFMFEPSVECLYIDGDNDSDTHKFKVRKQPG